MTNTGGTPAGWYHAPGDAEGTQRYWDGSQWIGEPQAVPQQAAPQAPSAPEAPQPPDATVAYNPSAAGNPPPYGGGDAGGNQPPSYGGAPGGNQPPAYGSPPPGAGAPPGYQAFGGAGTAGSPGTPAEFGQRAIAYLIDIAPIFGAYIIAVILAAIADVLAIIGLLLYLAAFGFAIWNFYIKQGKTGQTIGKEQQGIKLVLDQTGQPVGGGMAFVRYLVSGAFVLLCCIGSVVNLLSPLWNEDKKTYSDKIMKMSVVKAN